jgi:hypothetical protein
MARSNNDSIEAVDGSLMRQAISSLILKYLPYFELNNTYASKFSGTQTSRSDSSENNLYTQVRLNYFRSDNSRTAVPSTTEAAIRAAEERMATKIKEFDDTFEKADRVS